MAKREGSGTKRALIPCLAQAMITTLQLLNAPHKSLNEPIQIESQIQ